MPQSLYRFIWQSSRRQQVWLVLLTILVAPMSMIPLELQRRIVDDAIHNQDVRYMLLLCGIYLAVLLLQGGLKYVLNVYRGSLVEHIALQLRGRIFNVLVDEPLKLEEHSQTMDKGAVVSMTSSEVEEVAGFVGDSISIPLLQAGTAFGTLGYLFWVQPEIAAFALALFVPQIVIVPMGQRRINRWAAIHVRLLRKLGDVIVSSEESTLSRDQVGRRFAKLARGALTTRVLVYRVKFFLTLLGNFIDALGPLIVLAVGGWLVINGKAEVGTLVVFISGFQKVAEPWDQLLTFYRTTSNARTKYRLIVDTLPADRS
ncbi:MAG TPA: ABC transporter ATP-binding protein [Dongiaceae bacterium]|jgi:ABC-type bacteriocin/lantibiotic exporter with double-glycine peptidase domain|nr:ABC transporter ATP-binding protein [Dongiaceae bacterium]